MIFTLSSVTYISTYLKPHKIQENNLLQRVSVVETLKMHFIWNNMRYAGTIITGGGTLEQNVRCLLWGSLQLNADGSYTLVKYPITLL